MRLHAQPVAARLVGGRIVGYETRLSSAVNTIGRVAPAARTPELRRDARFSPAQIAYLDAVRFLAAEAVVIGHATHLLRPFRPLASGWLECSGVVVFFLLSGLLITGSTLVHMRSADYRLSHYLAARTCRIYAPYLPALALVAAADRALARLPGYPFAHADGPTQFFGNLFMLQEYPLFQILHRLGLPNQPWFIDDYGSARPFWTVAVEWWIYLLFGALAFLAVRRWRPRPAGVAAIAAVAIVPVLHLMGGSGRCMSLIWLLGLGTALMLSWRGWTPPRLRRTGRALTIGSAVLLVGRIAYAGFDPYDFQTDIFVAGLLFGPLMALSSRPASAFIVPWAKFGAGYSYSLYLIHYTVLVAAMLLLPHGLPALLLAILLANALSIGFWWLFERHYARMTKGVIAALDATVMRRRAKQMLLAGA